MKLRQHLKDLNNKLEVAIDRTHTVKKPTMPSKELDPEEEQMKIESMRKAVENTRKYLENLKRESDSLNKKDELEKQIEESK